MIKNDFDILLKNGNVAFYKTARILSFYLIIGGKVINFFTRATLDESDSTFKKKYILKSKINKNIQLGVLEEKVSINEIQTIFENLIDNNEWEDGTLQVDKLKPIQKVLVPSQDSVPVRESLEEFDNGSYLCSVFFLYFSSNSLKVVLLEFLKHEHQFQQVFLGLK